MALPPNLGVLLVAHGTVQSTEELPEFLLAIRRGRPPSADLISEMKYRYEAIGGSPLLKSTEAQARALSQGIGRHVYVGMRFCRPTIEEAYLQALSDGIAQLVVLPLAPYNVELYTAEAKRRILHASPVTGTANLELLTVTPWGNDEALIQAHAENIRAHASLELAQNAHLFLTAHSLPMGVIRAGDPYGTLTAAAAAAIGRALGVTYELCYQSEGADGGEWLGPSLSERLRVAANSGIRNAIVVPFGFLCDHVETLYDLDIELMEIAKSLGITLKRVPALGTHPGLLRTLTSLVLASWSRRENQNALSPEGLPQ